MELGVKSCQIGMILDEARKIFSLFSWDHLGKTFRWSVFDQASDYWLNSLGRRRKKFDDVKAEDRTEQFVKVLKSELEKTKACEAEFIADTTQEDYDDIVNGWSAKIVRCGDGDQKWGLFMATKPAI